MWQLYCNLAAFALLSATCNLKAHRISAIAIDLEYQVSSLEFINLYVYANYVQPSMSMRVFLPVIIRLLPNFCPEYFRAARLLKTFFNISKLKKPLSVLTFS